MVIYRVEGNDTLPVVLLGTLCSAFRRSKLLLYVSMHGSSAINS